MDPRMSNPSECLPESLLRIIRDGSQEEVLSAIQDVHLIRFFYCSGATLLHVAASCGNVWLAQFLIGLGDNVDALNNLKETPLMFAVQHNQLGIVQFLLEVNADIFVPDQNGKCALAKAFDSQLTSGASLSNPDVLTIREIVRVLLKRVTCESLKSRYVESAVFHVGCPLYMFMPLKNAEVTEILLQKGSPVDAKNSDTGETALHMAVEELDLQNVKALLKHGADVNMKDRTGNTPLACLENYCDQGTALAMVRMLMAAGATLIDRDHHIIQAKFLMSRGNKEIIRSVLSYNIDLHFRDVLGYTALHYLAENMNPDVFAELRYYNFDANIRVGVMDWTLLHLAASFGNASSVKFLLDRGADVDATHFDSYTPLSFILTKDQLANDRLDMYVKCVEILLARGANPRIVIKNNNWLRIISLLTRYNDLMIPFAVHLSAVAASGHNIGACMRVFILSNSQFKNVFVLKKAELKEMKEVKLGKSVTLLDFLVASVEKLSLYARKRSFVSNSFSEVKKDGFDPLYQLKLRESFLKFNKFVELRGKAAAALDKIISEIYNVSVYDVAEKIVEYLDDSDLYKLV